MNTDEQAVFAKLYGPKPEPKPEPSKPQPIRVKKLPGRNDPCPCGSGKKAKRCCLPSIQDLATMPAVLRRQAIVSQILGHHPSILVTPTNEPATVVTTPDGTVVTVPGAVVKIPGGTVTTEDGIPVPVEGGEFVVLGVDPAASVEGA